MKTESDLSNIQKWFTGRSVFITGGTGFMGKVLVEKLLRSCPTIKTIYLLVREKNNCLQDERYTKMLSLPIFDRIREECPHALQKISFIEGNLLHEDAGISQENKNLLFEQVSVTFHMGASLKLDAPLKEAILTNTLGTKRILELCIKMKQIKCVVHLSTAFCHCHIKELEEKTYQPNQDPYEMIDLVLKSETGHVLGKTELLGPHPNSYTFSKCLAEWLVKDYANVLPLVIARPSVVIPALSEPLPGWVDSLNGPVGIMVAAAKGVLRSMICNENYHAEIIPVDMAINALIAMSVVRGNCIDNELAVYNVTCPRELVAITWGDVLNRARNLIPDYPYEWTLWYPDGALRTNKFIHWFIVIFFQWIPALFIDLLLLMIRMPTFMIKLQIKLITATSALEYFTTTPWHFAVDRSTQLSKSISNSNDKELFKVFDVTYNIDDYMRYCILGSRLYCVKEKLSSLWFTRIHFKFLQIAHLIIKCTMWYYILWYVASLCRIQHFLAINYWLAIIS